MGKGELFLWATVPAFLEDNGAPLVHNTACFLEKYLSAMPREAAFAIWTPGRLSPAQNLPRRHCVNKWVAFPSFSLPPLRGRAAAKSKMGQSPPPPRSLFVWFCSPPQSQKIPLPNCAKEANSR